MRIEGLIAPTVTDRRLKTHCVADKKVRNYPAKFQHKLFLFLATG
jgi:hypothetical protein